MTASAASFARYQELQQYVGWTDEDRARIRAAAEFVLPHIGELIDDFYAEIQRHPGAARVITGGEPQVTRLKQTLHTWLRELFAGPYDELYVGRRWRVGLRHVEIGLPQVYAAAALSRLRNGMVRVLADAKSAKRQQWDLTLQSLNKLLDLDLAIISDAYETDYVQRQQEGERQRLGEVIHREKELAAGLLTHAQAAVLILDRAGRVVRSNPFVATLAQECVAGAEPVDWFESFLAEEDRARVRAALLDTAEDDGQPVTVSSVYLQAGRVRRLLWSAVPLRDAAGQRFGFLVIGQDVTELYEAQGRALQAERLAAIGQMATGLAHESRAALQRIGASAEMLELELEGNPAGLALVERIQHAQAHLHQLLEEVRSYAAPTVLDRSPCRISEVWREAWELLFAARRGRQIELRESIVARNLTATIDRFRLVQVFRNLLDNALAASSDPVLIEIRCEAATLGEVPALCIRVRDHGAGLTPEQRRRIFEPFYTTKPTGTGLGTAIAQRLVEAHGGTIAVGDCAGPGTEIVVVLPVGEA